MMGRSIILLACIVLLLPGASGTESRQQVSPVNKVISMMNDMMAKAKKEKQDEKVRFAAFSQFCTGTSKQRAKAIAKGSQDMERAAAEVASAEEDVRSYAKEIAGHENDISIWTADKAKAIDLRGEEHRIFQRVHAETADNLQSTQAALKTLEEGNKAQTQAALLQLSKNSKVPAASKKLLQALLQYNPAAALMQDEVEAGEMGTPQAAAFEGSSGVIVEIVQGLGDKLASEKKEIEEREANQLNAHSLQVNSLDGDVKKAKMESQMKASIKAGREQDRASAKADFAEATQVRGEDQKFLADLTAECELKTTDFQKRQVMRKGEIEAIQKAIEIMSSDDVAGGSQHTSLVQQKVRSPHTALAQLRSSGTTQQQAVQKVVANFLAERAQKINSRMLALFAARAESDPFAKVTKMVKDMIQKLMEEANEEASHKGFCDTEMGTNKVTRDTKTALVAELESTIEQLSSEINKLALEINETAQAMAEIDAALAKATADRQAEKEKNQETIQDGKSAQAATQNALQVLKEFYEKAANQKDLPEAEGPIKYDPRSLQILSKSSGGALVQQSQRVPGAPEMESGKYTGMENGGVCGMLEIIESDFADLIASTAASEAEAVRIYDQFMADSSQDKAVKDVELKHRQDKKTQKESDLQSARTDLRTAQQELQAAVDYFEKLKPSCVEVAMSYENKKAAREAEIESLQDALKILSQDDIN